MKIYCDNTKAGLSVVLERIQKKHQDYSKYNFSNIHLKTFLAFFDLAQEYETLQNFYRVSVFVPKIFLNFDCCLYLIDEVDNNLKMVCDSMNELNVCGQPSPESVHINSAPYYAADSYIIPIKSNLRLINIKPVGYSSEIIGMLEVFPASFFKESDSLFFEKFANRIGYNLHYKSIAIQNEDHIKFINNLVADIEHNVIVPNMRYKIFLNQFRKRLVELEQLDKTGEYLVTKLNTEQANLTSEFQNALNSIHEVHEELLYHYLEMDKHFQNTSLFLESLLRRDHFEKGEFVLRRRMCNVKKEIINTQIDRYKDRLSRRGIMIDDHLGGVPDEDLPLSVDIGLLSQVYANLFSNAEKYCQTVYDYAGNALKFVSYGREILPNYFGNGKDGIKFNVFTTGPHLSGEDAKKVYNEGFRAIETADRPGAGHGLHFIKKVVEVHGGVVGYETKYLGNNFYFILPMQKEIEIESAKLQDLKD